MSDTPETDKNLWDHGDEIDPSMRPDSHGNWVPEEFARKLERERGEANTKLQDVSSKLADALRERDEARNKYDELATEHMLVVNKLCKERDDELEKIKELIYISERAIALAEIDFENDKFGVVSELRDGLGRIKGGAK
jgi:hypothetical protein